MFEIFFHLVFQPLIGFHYPFYVFLGSFWLVLGPPEHSRSSILIFDESAHRISLLDERDKV